MFCELHTLAVQLQPLVEQYVCGSMSGYTIKYTYMLYDSQKYIYVQTKKYNYFRKVCFGKQLSQVYTYIDFIDQLLNNIY